MIFMLNLRLFPSHHMIFQFLVVCYLVVSFFVMADIYSLGVLIAHV
jgi:hypothetical protein